MKRAAVVLIIRDTSVPRIPVGYQREVLAVTNRKFSTLTLPGGTVDPGELPWQAAVRELREETTLAVEPGDLRLLGESVSHVAGEPDWFVTLFRASVVGGLPHQVENGTELYWRTFNRFLNESIFSLFYLRHLPQGIDHLPSTRFCDTRKLTSSV